MLRCIHGVGGHVNVHVKCIRCRCYVAYMGWGLVMLTFMWSAYGVDATLHTWRVHVRCPWMPCACACSAMLDVVLETQDLEWRIRCFRKFRSFDVQSEWRLGLLEITSRRQAKSEKKELSKTRMGMRWSFWKTFLVRNDVFAIAKYKILKKWGAPTALLTLPHEAFEDGMYQNTVNNGMWIQNRIKVTYK